MSATHLTFGQYDAGSRFPGAWRVEEAPGARWVADCPTPEQARLIAAAPELLAALQEIVRTSYLPPFVAGEEGYAAQLHLRRVALAAIAKATGGEVR